MYFKSIDHSWTVMTYVPMIMYVLVFMTFGTIPSFHSKLDEQDYQRESYKPGALWKNEAQGVRTKVYSIQMRVVSSETLITT